MGRLQDLQACTLRKGTMMEQYREIKKKKIILDRRKPWPEPALDNLQKWGSIELLHSFFELEGKRFSRLQLEAMLRGDVLPAASLGDYTYLNGLLDAAEYIAALTAEGKLPGMADLCRLWCMLEGIQGEAKVRKVWEEKTFLRHENPVVPALDYVPPYFREIPAQMDLFFGWLRKEAFEGSELTAAIPESPLSEDSLLAGNPIALAAEAHHRLLEIYPFREHNETLARLMAEACLMAGGLPLISWPLDERTYYESVRAYLKKSELRPLYRVLETTVMRCMDVALNLTEEE
ncbi:MAG: Fic family protein [Clostridiales bacterium]|nr:Fic family protein [Clostridiales bacterium]